MDIVIEFFRDTLDGPFYIVWVVILVILIFACIGYLAEKGINNKKEKEKYATVSNTSNKEAVQDVVANEPVADLNNATTQVDSTSNSPSIVEMGAVVNADTPSSLGEVSEIKDSITANNQVVDSAIPDIKEQPVINVENSNSTTTVDNNVVIPTINQDVNNKS